MTWLEALKWLLLIGLSIVWAGLVVESVIKDILELCHKQELERMKKEAELNYDHFKRR
jgi:hypothetical protein